MSQERPSLTKYDELDHYYCRQLGDSISFSYCRRMNSGLPCRLLFTCWSNRLDIESYVNENFNPEEIQKAFAQPSQGRMGTMFNALNVALKEKQSDNPNS